MSLSSAEPVSSNQSDKRGRVPQYFCDPGGFLLVEEKHSTTEERFYWVGKAASDRLLATRFTPRGMRVRTIVSAERTAGRLRVVENGSHRRDSR